MKFKSPYLVKPGTKVRLSSIKTGSTGEVASSDAAAELLTTYQKQLEGLQELLYASQQKAVLIVLQGMDTAGKDGTISSIFSGVNPQGCVVASFKVPTSLELRHDFLWRCHAQVPPRGILGIFNRSHYEDVLSPRVHGTLSGKEVSRRMNDINLWEESLTDNDVVVLKFFLHISYKEQTERLQSRIDDKSKHWKLSASDFQERRYWDDYMAAYQDIFRQTSTKHAPWFVIPADHKWYRNVAISQVLVESLKQLDLTYPEPSFDPAGIDLSTESPKEVAAETGERSAATEKAVTTKHKKRKAEESK